jgi:outer membrane protein
VISPRLPALLVAAAAFFGVTTSAAQGTKVAVVHVQAALLRTEDGMSMSATLKRYMDRHQNKLDRLQTSLKDEEKEIATQMPLLSRKAFQRRYMQYQNRMLGAQKTFFDAEKDLQKKQQDMMGPIMQKLNDAIRRVASRSGFDVVIDRTMVPYVRADLDLTDKVVQQYNTGGGAADPAPEAPRE